MLLSNDYQLICMQSNLDKVCTVNILPSTIHTISGILRTESSLTEDSVLNSFPQKSKELLLALSKLLVSGEPRWFSGWRMGPVKVFENGSSTELAPNASKDTRSIHIHPVQCTSLKNIMDCKRLKRLHSNNFTLTYTHVQHKFIGTSQTKKLQLW